MIATSNRGSEKILFGLDSVVIKKHISDIEGGRTLNVAGYPLNNIFAGSVVIKTADGDYAPMPIKALAGEDNAPVLDEEGNQQYGYDTLPEGAQYVGIVYRTVAKSNPQASVMIDGIVNEACVPFAVADIKEAFLSAVPHIIFAEDEDCGENYNA